MLNQLDQFVKKNGYECGIDKILHTATILHSGWEMDNEGWVVLLKNEDIKFLTTDHGSVSWWSIEEIEEKIEETSKSLKSLDVVRIVDAFKESLKIIKE